MTAPGRTAKFAGGSCRRLRAIGDKRNGTLAQVLVMATLKILRGPSTRRRTPPTPLAGHSVLLNAGLTWGREWGKFQFVDITR